MLNNLIGIVWYCVKMLLFLCAISFILHTQFSPLETNMCSKNNESKNKSVVAINSTPPLTLSIKVYYFRGGGWFYYTNFENKQLPWTNYTWVRKEMENAR